MSHLISEVYKYIDPDSGILPLTFLIWAIFGGFIIGMTLTFYTKSYVGETVRRLLKSGALSEDGAMTLAQLGIKPSRLRVHSLKDGALLSKYIAIANRTEAVKETTAGRGKRKKVKKTYDFNTARLYIREEKKYQADVRFEQTRKVSPLWLIFLAVVFIAAAIASSLYITKIIKMLDDFLQSIL